MAEAGIKQVEEQIALIRQQLGQELDVNIYHNDQVVALRGSVVTAALLEKLDRLPPAGLKFSREGAGAPEEKDIEQLIREQLVADPAKLVQEAGVTMDLTDEVRSMATRKVKEIFESCRYLTKLDLDAAADLAATLIRRASNLDAAAFKLRDLRNYDEYTYFHSVNVCVLGTTIFRDYVSSDQELLDFGIGLILHDIGKSKIDLKILNKPARLNEDEFTMMRRHVVYGYNLVRGNPNIPEFAKDLILNHHEWVNGAGYTRGLTEEQLSVYDMVAAVCDVFDAVTTNRLYQSKMDVHRAVSILIRGSGTHFQTRIVNHFLRGIGRFPVGTFVQLSNGEIGVVSRINANALALPVIRVIFDTAGSKLAAPKTVDLYQEQDLYIERPLDTTPTMRLQPAAVA